MHVYVRARYHLMMKLESQSVQYRANFIALLLFVAAFSGILLSSSWFLSGALLITPTNGPFLIAHEAVAEQTISSREETAALVTTIQFPIKFSDSLQYNNTELGFGLQYPSNAQIEEAGESVFFRLPDGLVSVFVDRNMEQQQEQQPSQQLREYTDSILDLLRQSYEGFTLERIGNYTLPEGYASEYVMFSFNNGRDDGLGFTTSTANMTNDDNIVGYILLFTTPVSNSTSFQDNIVDSIVSSFKINKQPVDSHTDDTSNENQDDDGEEDKPIIRF
jgi:hypothetical protein